MTSYIIPENLSEKQIETDVAMYLGWCSAGLPFRLLDVNEQLTGADKLFDVVMPIYLQFKKSTGLKPLTNTPAPSKEREPVAAHSSVSQAPSAG